MNEATAPPTPPSSAADWRPMPDAARTVAGIVGAIVALPIFGGGAIFLAVLLADGLPARSALRTLEQAPEDELRR